jgi:hypothetical protein
LQLFDSKEFIHPLQECSILEKLGLLSKDIIYFRESIVCADDRLADDALLEADEDGFEVFFEEGEGLGF